MSASIAARNCFRVFSRALSFVATYESRTSLDNATALSRAADSSSVTGTRWSRKPASSARYGSLRSAVITARLKCSGASRCQQTSVAKHGTVRPISTSFKQIFDLPAGLRKLREILTATPPDGGDKTDLMNADAAIEAKRQERATL